MEKVATVGVKREKGYLYFVDKQGDAARAHRANGRADSGSGQEKVAIVGVEKDKRFLYFIDKQGDISRSPLKRKARA